MTTRPSEDGEPGATARPADKQDRPASQPPSNLRVSSAPFRAIAALLDDGAVLTGAAFEEWIAATEALLGGAEPRSRESLLGRLAHAWTWPEVAPRVRHLGAEAQATLVASVPAEAQAIAVAAREIRLHELAARDDDELAAALIASTEGAIALLETLRDPDEMLAARVAARFPELAALAVVAPGAVEHEPPLAGSSARPLLDHLAQRSLGRKLRGLERADRAVFQRDQALSAAGFADEVARLRRLETHGLAPAVRAALVHLDFAKGGGAAVRQRWTTALGVDLSVHNLAAARILERSATLARFTALRPQALSALVIALVESHGTAGQRVRGETPLSAFAPFVAYLRGPAAALAAELGVAHTTAIELAADALHVIDVCDTAGVREGLLTDGLRAELLAVRDRLVALAAPAALAMPATDDEAPEPAAPAATMTIDAELADVERRGWEAVVGGDAAMVARARLGDRLARLRQGRQRGGEPRQDVDDALAAVGDVALLRLDALLAPCQLWYAEAATGRLTPAAQLKVLALAAQAQTAAQAPRREGRPYHVSLEPLIARLGPGDGDGRAAAEARYRIRLLEAMLAARSVDDILSGQADELAARRGPGASGGGLGSFTTAIGGSVATVLDFEESAEARALLTLLAIYETKSSAAFHATLKALCDLYDLRKDEFDRVANEASYLVTMNAARGDKARMLDHVRPGRIVEVGPGGGVVLDLLEERFPDSEIIGLDVSRMVVEALQQKRQREGHRWRIVCADAFALPEHLGVGGIDTVVFCSVLHEIYSYVERPGDDGSPPRRFRLESVRDLLRAAWAALGPGGRLVIRDGVAPEPARRRLRFLAADARELFDLFVVQFEGRTIRATALGPDEVELDAWDAMEFLYTYTWGPDSFPYEVREQYGVLPYRAYRAQILAWLDGARAVELAPEAASYLQPGYRNGLAGKIALSDGDRRPVELPDSNCLMVFEKP